MPGHRENYLEWEEYFMSIAFLSAQRSKDPRTQVGACIVNSDKKIVGIGYNGMPIGCDDKTMPWNRAVDGTKESWYNSKSPYVCHAELNAVLNKNQADVKDCVIYVALFPCNMCAQIIVQSGIREVVYYSDKYHERLEFAASRRLLEMAGIKYRQLKPRMDKVVIKFDIIENATPQEQNLPPDQKPPATPQKERKTDMTTLKENCELKNGENWARNGVNNNNIFKRKKVALFNYAEQQNLPENVAQELLHNVQIASPLPSETMDQSHHFQFLCYSVSFVIVVLAITWLITNSGMLLARL